MISNHTLRILWGENNISKEEFYPFLAYIRADGRANNILFSSFIFDFSAIAQPLDVWEQAIDLLFTEGQGIDALNSAVGDVKTLFSASDKKCDVYFSFPRPRVSLEPFGDMNKDGITEKILDTEDCVTAVNWFINSVKRRLAASNLPNITVKGWIYNNNDDEEFLKGSIAAINEKGYDAIPENCAPMLNIYEITSINAIEAPCIFSCDDWRFLLNSAVSEDIEIRKPYDKLYNLISGEDTEIIPDAEETAITEEILPDDEVIPEEIIIGEITPTETEILSDALTDELSREKTTLPRKPKTQKRRSIDKDKKCMLIGAGIAAAALGLAYIIKKSQED